MNQIFEDLPPELSAILQEQRDWVKGHYIENADEEYASIEGKLRLLDVIIKEKWIEPHETYKLQSLGATLGDAFAMDEDYKWLQVTDELGTDPALRYKQTSIVIFPRTMISKRIENGEDVDVYDLFLGIKKYVQDKASEANPA